MILDSELDAPTARPPVLTRWRMDHAFSARSGHIIALFLFFALAVALQFASGTYHS